MRLLAFSLAPEGGLDRGVWEAPRWAFFVAIGVVVVLGALYLARRLGWLRLRRTGAGGKERKADAR